MTYNPFVPITPSNTFLAYNPELPSDAKKAPHDSLVRGLNSPSFRGVACGSDRRRSGDLSIFSPAGSPVEVSAEQWDATDAEAQRLEETAEALDTLGVKLPCQRAVRMIGTSPETGEQKEIELRCDTRKARVCPSCAALYRGDIQAIMREGIHAAKGQGEQIVFLTLTAPSFGRTHYVPPTPPPRLNARRRSAWDRRYRRPCPCGQLHSPGDPRWKGIPADVDAYDHDGQVRWNAAAGRLWSRTADELTRILDVRDDEGKRVRMPYVAVAEWQSRGAIHLHVIARIPATSVASLDPVHDHARGKNTTRLRRIEREATAVTTVVDDETIRWGTQCVAEMVATERSMIRTAGYLAKVVGYAVKDLTREAGVEEAHTPALAEHHRRLEKAAHRLRCGSPPQDVVPDPWHPKIRPKWKETQRWFFCEYNQRGGKPSGAVPFEGSGQSRPSELPVHETSSMGVARSYCAPVTVVVRPDNHGVPPSPPQSWVK